MPTATLMSSSSGSIRRWFTGRPLAQQLWLTIAVVVVAGLVSTTATLLALRSVATDARTLQRSAIVPLATAGELQAEVQKLRVAYRDVAFDAAQRAAASERVAGSLQSIDSLRQHLVASSTDSGTVAALAAFSKNWQVTQVVLESFLTASRAGDDTRALFLLRGELREKMGALEREIERVAVTQVEAAGGFATRTVQRSERSQQLALLIVAVGLLAAALISQIVIGRVAGSVSRIRTELASLESESMANLERATAALSVGQLDAAVTLRAQSVDIDGADELARLGNTYNATVQRTTRVLQSYEVAVDTLRQLLIETARVVHAAEQGRTSVRAEAHRFAGAYQELLQGFNAAQDAAQRPVDAALDVLEQVADRNLSVRVEGAFAGDHARLAAAINTAVHNVGEALHEVEVSAEQIASAAHEVSTGSQHLAVGASHQAASVEEITAAVQEQAAVTMRTVKRLDEARGMARSTRERLRAGTQSMQDLGTAMGRMTSSAERTGQIVKTIDEIAFQTNLLALNAAVEAARAGDAGRGFAVVADEVRQLAIRAAAAARETSTLIEETIGTARESQTIASHVQTELNSVDGDVERVTTVVEQVADDCTEQRQQIEDVRRGVETVSDHTQRAAANAEESASASEELNAQAASMRVLVNKFVVVDARGEPRNMARRVLHARTSRPYMEKRAG